MLEITADVGFAEHLEKIAFNALPTQISDDFMRRQYFQQANQVQITRQMYNFDVNHQGTDVVFGLLTGYPCCTSNMHQGWPKFTQNLYYATANKGVASMIYAPSSVLVKVGQAGKSVQISQETFYPFESKINLKINHREKLIEFPYQLRIPSWAKNPKILINGEEIKLEAKPGTVIEVNRKWKNNDIMTLDFPMELNYETYHEGSRAIERGPLVFALDIPGEEKEVFLADNEKVAYGDSFIEVRPKADWNFGLPLFNKKEMNSLFQISETPNPNKLNPWNRENAPLALKVKARQLPFWKLYNGMAGPLPSADMYGLNLNDLKEVEIRLIPYGCTTLRISQFPMLRK